jgi:hypothetical protein
MKRITSYELIPHGFDHSQYFQGCGVSFTEFEHVQTGAGCSEQEAFEDALTLLYGSDNIEPFKKFDEESKEMSSACLPIEHSCGKDGGEDFDDCGCIDQNEVYFHFSIRYNLETIDETVL